MNILCNTCGKIIKRNEIGVWEHTGDDTGGAIPRHPATPQLLKVDRKFGYLHGPDDENHRDLEEAGTDTELVLSALRSEFPQFNAYAIPFILLLFQGMQGACQGHALAHIFQLALIQKYGIQAYFSRGGAYYLSQLIDGINGDKGSTLSAGRKVAANGLCLETEWAYPGRYDPRKPSGIDSKLNFRMPGSKLVKDADLAWEILKAGGAIQTGVAWTRSFETEVADRYSSGGNVGGHSTILYGLEESTGNAWHHNSWKGWMGDSRSRWTKNFFAQILRQDRWAVFVAYDSTNLEIPSDAFERIGVER